MALPSLDASPRKRDWKAARRSYDRLRERLTQGYPQSGHGDFVHVYATLISPALVKAEAWDWGARLDRPLPDVRARARRHLRPGSLRFEVELSNHRWPWLDQDIRKVLETCRLEVDGRSFPIAAVEPVFFGRMLRGQARVLRFDTPPGELHLPGPEAKQVRLVFPYLENKRRRGGRLRAQPSRKWRQVRVGFPSELFGLRWSHATDGT